MSLVGENGTQLTMPVMPAYGGMVGCGMGGFGGDGWCGILFLIAIMCGGWGGFGGFGGINGLMGMWPFMFGGFGNGFGGSNASAQGALTRGELCQDMNFQDVKNGVSATESAVNQGFSNLNSTICHQQYDTAQLVNGLGMNVMQGFSQAELAETQRQAALMQQLYQMGYNQQDCCCRTQSAIERVNYDAAMRGSEANRLMERGFCENNYNQATNTTAIIQNAHNDTDRILARLDAMERSQDKAKIAEQAAEIQAYKQNAAFGAMISASEQTILRRTGAECPTAAYIVQPPQPVSFATNCSGQAVFNNGWGNNGCGCNSGCGGC